MVEDKELKAIYMLVATWVEYPILANQANMKLCS